MRRNVGKCRFKKAGLPGRRGQSPASGAAPSLIPWAHQSAAVAPRLELPWPPGFQRIPDQEWTEAPVERLALGYDTVEHHGWYRNLDPTVDQLEEHLGPGKLLVDYSGGTGILLDRLIERVGDRPFGAIIADSSEKFLRLALEKLGSDPRVGFRHLRYIPEERRVETLQEVLEPTILERGIDVLTSTNAIHLYYGLDETLRSWHDALRPGGIALIQSGNIGVPQRADGTWIIDETVEAIQQHARAIVREDDYWVPYRDVLDDDERMTKHDKLRRKFFLPVRPLGHYKSALEGAGFEVTSIEHKTFHASVRDWTEFLAVYHEGVLGWVGGCKRVEGTDPTLHAIADRQALLAAALQRLFAGQEEFPALWTYFVAKRP
jgi:SAM-dependent methyltransferase